MRHYRSLVHLSQGQLAKAAGVSQQLISHIERGASDGSHRSLVKIAQALGCRVAELDPTCEAVEPSGSSWLVPVFRPEDVAEWFDAGGVEDSLPAPLERQAMAPLECSGPILGFRVRDRSIDRIAPVGALVVLERERAPFAPGDFYGFVVKREFVFGRYKNDDFRRLSPYSTDPDLDAVFLPEAVSFLMRIRRIVIDL
ncbi:DNA-binding XRE family transcriptional regulator [Breoghania corrubedonensis]|uniref:DNA-binding XRE family transcriptional regulator n=1 Tax=Breoghania corrubedonensis TaxID=665038 RepID=A0A2T5UQ06_9HYPH|nr:DNA-binding XRE family transcriptional regulator [Breoghania corrubedonensis]